MFSLALRTSVSTCVSGTVYSDAHVYHQLNTVRPNLFGASSLIARRFLSQENRAKIQEAIKAKPVVLFMKGTPDIPQCGFSRAAVQVLDLEGVDVSKMQTYNVLEDSQLREDIKAFS
jgi:monothiol glutaredoxin